MKEIHIDDIWLAWNDGYYIVIPTNGFVKPTTGECVMGRGLAWQAKERFPKLPLELGERIRKYGNVVFVFMEYRLFTFPVKYNWWEKADLQLIEKSCQDLQKIYKYNLMDFPTPLYLPKVGCGNGKLKWEDVKPILEKYLNDRFIICNLEKKPHFLAWNVKPVKLYRLYRGMNGE